MMRIQLDNKRLQMHSHKNTSMGGSGKGGRLPIKENKAHVPPAGASNSYEKVSKKIEAHDNASLHKKAYTKEKMMNK